MSATRLLRLAAMAPLLVVGLVPAAPSRSVEDATPPEAPVQLLELTTATGEVTQAGEAGLEEPASPEVAAGTGGGMSVLPQLAGQLAALLPATPTNGVDPEADAVVLTEPLEVDDFLVAGFTWSGGQDLPEGLGVYLRVREDGVWSQWYLNEAAGSGPDDGAGLAGTDEFVTGGADAVQASVVGDAADLPADLTLALVPGQPAGEEVLDVEDLEPAEAEPTPVATEPEETLPTEPSAGPVQETAAPAPGPQAQFSPVAAGTSTGRGVNPSLPAMLAATTTINGLPVPVHTRAEWGANAAYMTWTPRYVAAAHVVVHHTAGTNSYTASESASVVRGIYYYHAVTRDWGDIGYNFLVDKYGQVFEGRAGTLSAAAGTMVVGGHAYGANTGTMGISMMGTYTSVSPTSTQLTKVGQIAGWFLRRSGVTNPSGSAPFTFLATDLYSAGQTISLPRISGHRDVGRTTCPGDAGYSAMSTIRSAAAHTRTTSAESPVDLTGTGSWVAEGSRWWWRSNDGGYPASTWARISGSTYYFDAGGYMATGWQTSGSSWYYLDTTTGAMRTGTLALSDGTYFLGSSGAMTIGWFKHADGWRYYRYNGQRAAGWHKDGSYWYYLTPSTGIMRTGTLTLPSGSYFLLNSGAMTIGWFSHTDGWRYYLPTGERASGWQRIRSTWYYLAPPSGVMVTGTRVIDGVTYTFSSSGAWVG